eukprot:3406261-Rhodomonas_salina.1
MYGGIREMYKEHHYLGILKTTGLDPKQCSIYNRDEVGFDPSCNWAHSLKFASQWDKLAHMIRTGPGEKVPFWASVLFWSRADRQFAIQPTIIHQGQPPALDVCNVMKGLELLEDGQTPAHFLPDQWCEHQSPSAYNDPLGFSRIIEHFLLFCCTDRPLYLFIDGH